MNKPVTTKKEGFVFARENYILLFVGIALTMIGFILMIGGKSDDPNVFNPELFNTQRITVAPIMVLAGFVTVIFAIMKKSKSKSE